MDNVFNRFSKDIISWLNDVKGYVKPTDPQIKAIPPIMEGKNVLLRAPTGYGKTLAVMLPIIDRLSKNSDEGIQALYIAPLKSLNRDVFQRIVELGSKVGVDIDVRHSDTTARSKSLQSKIPPKIMITTPETLHIMMTGVNLRKSLANVKAVVIDEIHEIFESKRGSQLSAGLERLSEICGSFQRIGLSATIGDIEEIKKFLCPNDECTIVKTDDVKRYEITIEYPDPVDEDNALADNLSISANNAYLLRKIKEYLRNCKNCIIFTNTRQMAEILGNRLKDYLKSEFVIDVHHSSLSKALRLEVEDKFKKGEIKAIIATSSLELGIDIGSVDLVIQYSSPRQVTKLAQRIGRGGHRVGEISRGVIFAISVDDLLEGTAIVEKLHEGWLEKQKSYKKPYDVLLNHIVGILVSTRKGDEKLSRQKMHQIMKRSYTFQDLSYEEFLKIVDFMVELKLIYTDGDYLIRTRKALSYFYENISMIPDERSYNVIDELQNKKVGILHQGFVVEHCKIGSSFIMKGDVWKINDVVDDKILVVRSNEEGAIPSWEGELIPVSMGVALKVGALRKRVPATNILLSENIMPDEKNLLLEFYDNIAVLHCCFGNLVNTVIANAVSSLASTKIGATVGNKVDAYRIIFSVPEYENPRIVLDILNGLQPEWLEDVIKASLKNASIFHFKFFQVAKKMGIIMRNAEFNAISAKRLLDIYQNSPAAEEAFKEIMTDKMDLNNAKALVGSLKNGDIKISINDSKELSPLGVLALEESRSFSIVRPENADGEINRIIDSRLLNKEWFFICTHCGEPFGTFRTKSFDIENSEKLACRLCGSTLIGFVKPDSREFAQKELKKSLRNMEHDEKLVSSMDKTALLNQVYGANAIYIMSAYGIGPESAKRILQKTYKNRKELVKAIINAEKTFLRTKRFWA